MKLDIRDGWPAVNVKDSHLWARELSDDYAVLDQREVDAIYEGTARDLAQEVNSRAVFYAYGVSRLPMGTTVTPVFG